MDQAPSAKCSCQHCGVHLEFPTSATGMEIKCPNCSNNTLLQIPEETEPQAGFSVPTIVGAFSGPVRRSSVSPFYTIGLGLAAGLMLLLPIIYILLTMAVGWLTLYWATHATWLLKYSGGVRFHFIKIACYAAPLFAGFVLSVFMIKPLFAKRPRRAEPLALNPSAEPVLFTFISKICETVRAPYPTRIDLDCQLNASARFRRGTMSFLGNDLVLTIGLPLVAGLTVKQFAGVLAHEFGHFSQGVGMRFSYVIGRINGWFGRLVYQRDTWDQTLEQWQEEDEGWISLFAGLARLGVWFTRQILKLLMYIGHGISCFLSRQMEYDADTYEMKVAGSRSLEETMRRIHVLSHILHDSYKGMRAIWHQNRRLPESFPAFLLAYDQRLLPEARTHMEDTMGLEATGWFDTHPSNGDRIRRARQANYPGVFDLEGPATALFTNFDALSKQVTLLHYDDDLGIAVHSAKLFPVEKLLPTIEDHSSH